MEIKKEKIIIKFSAKGDKELMRAINLLTAAQKGLEKGSRAYKKELKKLIGYDVQVNVNEVKRPGIVAKLVGQNIAQQLVKKVNYRRAVKKSIQSTMSIGANGIRICVAGRLNGAEIARSETFREGRVPLHTLRSQIDYAIVESNTTYGIIGVKVWIYNENQKNN